MPALTGVAQNNDVLLALIALVATMLTLLGLVIRTTITSKTAAVEATAANHAVNGVGPEAHRLYDRVATIADQVDKLVAQQHDFETHGWGTLPPDLATAVGLTVTIRDLQRHTLESTEKLNEIRQLLVDHVEWETSQKWGHHDDT